MGWHIDLNKNTVTVSRECVEDILKADADIVFAAQDWGGHEDQVEYLWDGENLKFDCDHMEHMDYVWQVMDILCRHRVKGDIAFSSADGDNAGTAWCYRFDGEGGCERLSRKIDSMWD